jgi:hypothetical protein
MSQIGKYVFGAWPTVSTEWLDHEWRLGEGFSLEEQAMRFTAKNVCLFVTLPMAISSGFEKANFMSGALAVMGCAGLLLLFMVGRTVMSDI